MSQRLFKIDVLIVGAGPVGLTAAIELARYGVLFRVIDSSQTRSKFNKACVIWPRTLEQLRRHQWIVKRSMSREIIIEDSTTPATTDCEIDTPKIWQKTDLAQVLIEAGTEGRYSHIYENSKLLASLDHSKTDSPYPFYLTIGQCQTEKILESRLKELGGMVERGSKLVNLFRDVNGVTATVITDNFEQTIHCRWLIACDGVHSTVRRLCGLKFTGVTLPTEWVTIDCTIAPEDPADLPGSREAHSNSGGSLTYVLLKPPNFFRVGCPVGRGPVDRKQERPPPTLEEVQALIDKYDHRSLKLLNPKWIARFMVNERVVEEYRVGRILIAGDAAHVHSPAGGQGMNLGMHDAVNLSWKLAMILRNQISDAAAEIFLESYGLERKPIAEAVIQSSGTLTRVLSTESKFYKWLANRALSIGTSLFDLEESLLTNLTFATWCYPDSPLNKESNYLGLYGLMARANLRAGDRYPLPKEEPPLSPGDTPLFTIATVPDQEHRAVSLCKSFNGVLSDTIITSKELNTGAVILIRPDGFIAFMSTSSDWFGLFTYLCKLTRPQTLAPH